MQQNFFQDNQALTVLSLPQAPHEPLPPGAIAQFQTIIYSYYKEHRREFPWRATQEPYHIVVSEIMLQQTQTSRVIDKYQQFVAVLPNFEALANASQREVLALWSGLGYNRRGLALQNIAKRVMADFAGVLPSDPIVLEALPGIGPNTAGSICAFAFNKPVVFIETNIRAIYLHFFFRDKEQVKDRELLPLIEATLDRENSREWYYALMDYGVMLKKSQPNPSRKSASHTKQSTFEGSERQIRGLIIKLLTQHPALSFDELCGLIPRDPVRITRNLADLLAEGLVQERSESGQAVLYFL